MQEFRKSVFINHKKGFLVRWKVGNQKIGNQKSEIRNPTLCPDLSIEKVGIGCGPLDIWRGRGDGGRWAIFFLHNFFSEPKTLPDIFFANISLHDFFSYSKRSSLCDLFGLMTWNQFFLVMGLRSSARFVFFTGIHLLWNLCSNFFWYLPSNPPPPLKNI